MVLPELPLSRATVDRAAHRRAEDGLVAGLVADPRTRVLLVRQATVAVVPGTSLLDLRPSAAVGTDGTQDAEHWFFLGEEPDGQAFLARVLGDDERLADPTLVHRSDDGVHLTREPGAADPPPRDDWSARPAQDAPTAGAPGGDPDPAGTPVFVPLRDVGAQLTGRDAGLATAAVALAAWHVRHPRCPRCGSPTRVTQAGWARTCVADGSEHYPRTDPAVIMAVVDASDRILLGHSAAWPEGRFSTLAGFVEAGEPPESAVRREVLEETGVRVGAVEYRGSQPWPFPASLMLGYRAEALSTDLVPDGVEMTDARWYTRDALRADVAAGRLVLPGRASIAHALVAEWFGGPLPQARDGV